MSVISDRAVALASEVAKARLSEQLPRKKAPSPARRIRRLA